MTNDDLKYLPKPVWVTTEEGGNYIPWKEWTLGWEGVGRREDMIGRKHKFRIHSVGLDNGLVFDNYGGWRSWSREDVTHDLLVRMGLEKPASSDEAMKQAAAGLSRSV